MKAKLLKNFRRDAEENVNIRYYFDDTGNRLYYLTNSKTYNKVCFDSKEDAKKFLITERRQYVLKSLVHYRRNENLYKI